MGADTYFCRIFHLHLYKKWFVTLGISVWLLYKKWFVTLGISIWLLYKNWFVTLGISIWLLYEKWFVTLCISVWLLYEKWFVTLGISVWLLYEKWFVTLGISVWLLYKKWFVTLGISVWLLYEKWFVTLGISVWLFWNFQAYWFHLYFVDRTHKLIFHIHMKLVEYNFALRIDLFYIQWATSRCYHGSRVQCKCGIWCNKYLLFLHNSITTGRSRQTVWLWISIILSHMFTYGLFFSMSLHYKNLSSYYQTIAYSRHDMNCSWQIDDLL
jgi:hypothetical protein